MGPKNNQKFTGLMHGKLLCYPTMHGFIFFFLF